MKTHKLINTKTKEEHLCDKITIDGFDYYVSDEKLNIDDYYISWETNYATEPKERYILYNLCSKTNGYNPRKVVATTNPDIDIPKVVDEVDQYTMAKEYAIKTKSPNRESHRQGFVKGYNKSQETHPFSEEDMIEFAKYYKVVTCNCKGEIPHPDKNSIPNNSVEVNLQLWKEHRPKIIYYE